MEAIRKPLEYMLIALDKTRNFLPFIDRWKHIGSPLARATPQWCCHRIAPSSDTSLTRMVVPVNSRGGSGSALNKGWPRVEVELNRSLKQLFGSLEVCVDKH